jgi:hypothetical protein
MNKLWKLLTLPYRWWKARRALKQRIQELRRRDPFIYK